MSGPDIHVIKVSAFPICLHSRKGKRSRDVTAWCFCDDLQHLSPQSVFFFSRRKRFRRQYCWSSDTLWPIPVAGKKVTPPTSPRGMWGKAESWFVSSFPGLMRIQEDRHASRRKGNRVRNSMSPSKSRVEQNVRWC